MTEISPTILHVDMDAFFAQVEQLRDPSLKGKPVCVGGIPGKDRGVVAAASYEARKYGIHAAMPLGQAKKLCPQAVFLRARGHAYLEISKRVVAILGEFSDRVEPSSIDESYLDITGVLNYFGGAENVGRGIKERILSELHLTCTVGIGPTRIIAKMATNMHKPDGLTIIEKADIPAKIYPLPVEKVPGIGPRMQKTLNGMGIHTLGQLANASENFLFKRLGVHGPRLQKIARGELDWTIVRDEERPDDKSIGNSRTFGQDSSDPEVLKRYLLTLVGMIGRRLREADMVGKTVTLTIRYGDFHTVTHQKSIRRVTNDENDIFRIAWRLFEERYITGMPVRLLGVSVSKLQPRNAGQMDIFDRETKLYSAMDTLREKFGETIVRRTSTMDIKPRSHKRTVNFARPNRNEQRRTR